MKKAGLFFLTILVFQGSFFASAQYRFEHIALPASLQSKKVNCLMQDSKGFLWVGLSSGLVLYDGYRAKVVEGISADGQPFQFGHILALYEDAHNRIWVSSMDGLYVHDPVTKTSTSFEAQGITNERCRSMIGIADGKMAIGTNNGLRIVDLEKREVTAFRHHQGIAEGLSHNIVRALYEDKKGLLWVGTYDGLNRYDPDNNTFQHFLLQKNSGADFSNNLILSITPFSATNDTLLWVGTETGLCLFNTTDQTFEVYRRGDKETGLSNNVIKTLEMVSPEEIWMGTDFGLNVFDPEAGQFSVYLHDFDNTYSISNNSICVILKDKNGCVWLGTENGLDKTYVPKENFLTSRISENAAPLRRGMVVNDFTMDERQDIWMATNDGLVHYSREADQFTFFRPPAVLHNKIREVYSDHQGKVWIATSGGLNVFDIDKNRFYGHTAEKAQQRGINTNYVYCIEEDLAGNIWIGTYNEGLYKVDQLENDELAFINFKHDPQDALSISSDVVNDIVADSNGDLWIATNNGLNRFDPVQGTFERFMSGEFVRQLFYDGQQTFYISSSSGFSKLDLPSVSFEHYASLPGNINGFTVHDGYLWFSTLNLIYRYDLKAHELLEFPSKMTGIDTYTGGVFKDDTGKLFFGGYEGFVAFDPDELSLGNVDVQVYLTEFYIGNEPVSAYPVDHNSENVLRKNIDDVRRIVLDYEQNTFGIEFSTLTFDDHRSIQYAYILDGYQENWQKIDGANNTAAYTKVKPGKYTFKVKASNPYGIFSDAYRSVDIEVLPPLWASPGALAIYSVILVILFLLSRRMLIARIKFRNDIRLERLRREESEALYNTKISFFTNISHELRTPLTLILSPLEQLVKQEEDPYKVKVLHTAKRSADRLLKMVNQLLDLRKIDAGADRLVIQYYDFVAVCKRVLGDFYDGAERKNIALSFSAERGTLMMWFDMEKVEKILYNLLSNALKFTPENGDIRMKLAVAPDRGFGVDDTEKQYVKVSVSDTGIGIPAQYQTSIFERFVNVRINNHDAPPGSGIGLSLVRSFVEQHNGYIEFESKEKAGTTFNIYLPTEKSMLSNYKESECDVIERAKLPESIENEPVMEVAPVDFDGARRKKPNILIVEDDPDMQAFVSDCLRTDYRVMTANNGKEGWRMACSQMPDIVISDVMMPELNGARLCQKIKGDTRTAHIPVVLLTALSGVSHEMEGVQSGADAYLVKPFNVDFLLLKIQVLIEQREQLRTLYLNQSKLEPSEVAVEGSADEQFLEKVVVMIEKEMDNAALNVQELSNLMGLSHTVFYRKVKALTGLTATEFIRTVRLKRAAQLLKADHLNITDVMYMVGFTNRSYFTRSFRQLFGVSPREYRYE